MTIQLWIQDTTGEVTCKDHAGHYLKSAIVANPKRISYWTELGTWDSYYTHLLGGANLVCEVCTPWDSPDHPYNKLKAVA